MQLIKILLRVYVPLSIVLVKVLGDEGGLHTSKALLHTGYQTNLIT